MKLGVQPLKPIVETFKTVSKSVANVKTLSTPKAEPNLPQTVSKPDELGPFPQKQPEFFDKNDNVLVLGGGNCEKLEIILQAKNAIIVKKNIEQFPVKFPMYTFKQYSIGEAGSVSGGGTLAQFSETNKVQFNCLLTDNYDTLYYIHTKEPHLFDGIEKVVLPHSANASGSRVVIDSILTFKKFAKNPSKIGQGYILWEKILPVPEKPPVNKSELKKQTLNVKKTQKERTGPRIAAITDPTACKTIERTPNEQIPTGILPNVAISGAKKSEKALHVLGHSQNVIVGGGAMVSFVPPREPQIYNISKSEPIEHPTKLFDITSNKSSGICMPTPVLNPRVSKPIQKTRSIINSQQEQVPAVPSPTVRVLPPAEQAVSMVIPQNLQMPSGSKISKNVKKNKTINTCIVTDPNKVIRDHLESLENKYESLAKLITTATNPSKMVQPQTEMGVHIESPATTILEVPAPIANATPRAYHFSRRSQTVPVEERIDTSEIQPEARVDIPEIIEPRNDIPKVDSGTEARVDIPEVDSGTEARVDIPEVDSGKPVELVRVLSEEKVQNVTDPRADAAEMNSENESIDENLVGEGVKGEPAVPPPIIEVDSDGDQEENKSVQPNPTEFEILDC